MEERYFFFRGAKIINELRFNVANAAGRKYTDFMPRLARNFHHFEHNFSYHHRAFNDVSLTHSLLEILPKNAF